MEPTHNMTLKFNITNSITSVLSVMELFHTYKRAVSKKRSTDVYRCYCGEVPFLFHFKNKITWIYTYIIFASTGHVSYARMHTGKSEGY
jgi:hypothetical protein